jgi:hypothetical protein
MNRVRVFGALLLFLIATAPIGAISPSWVMFYGGPLRDPIVAAMYPSNGTTFLWDTYPTERGGARLVGGRLERGRMPANLVGRPFVHFAIFWGRWNERPTKPEEASQHGRLYLPTATAPAVVVLTWAWMEDENASTTGRPAARPIPTDLGEHRDASGAHSGFVVGRTLAPADVAVIKRAGVPGL